jgi:hypothetical protein
MPVAAMKARPIAARTSQRRQQTLLVIAAMIFVGMLMLRGEVMLNLKTMFPIALDSNVNVSLLHSFYKLYFTW